MSSRKHLANLLNRFNTELKIGSEESVTFRTVLLAYIRSSTFAAKYIGIYVNRNTSQIIDHDGECLEDFWIIYLEELIKCPIEQLSQLLNKIHRKVGQMTDFGDGLATRLILYTKNNQLNQRLTELLEFLNVEFYFYENIFFGQFCWFIKNNNINNTILKYEDYLIFLKSLISKLEKFKNIERYMPFKCRNKQIEKVFQDLNLKFIENDSFYEFDERSIKVNFNDQIHLICRFVQFFSSLGFTNIGVFINCHLNSTSQRFLEPLCKISKIEKSFLKEIRQFDFGICIDNNLVFIYTKIKEFDFFNCLYDPVLFYFLCEHLINFNQILFDELPNRFLEVKVMKDTLKNNFVDDILKSYRCKGGVEFVNNVIKVFVEGRNQNIVDDCILELAQFLYDNNEGVGPYPEINYV